MIHHLMCQPPVVLKHVVVDGAGGFGDFLHDGQDLGECVRGDVGQLGAVVFWDDELGAGWLVRTRRPSGGERGYGWGWSREDDEGTYSVPCR